VIAFYAFSSKRKQRYDNIFSKKNQDTKSQKNMEVTKNYWLFLLTSKRTFDIIY